MNTRRFKISTRLAIGFTLILVILVVVVMVSVMLVRHNKDRLKQGLEVSTRKAQVVATMKSSLLQSGIAMRNMLDFSVAKDQKTRVEHQHKLYASAQVELTQFRLSDQEVHHLSALDALNKSVEGHYRRAMHQAEMLNPLGAASIITKDVDPINIHAINEIDKLIQAQQREQADLLSSSERDDKQLTLLLIVVMAIGVGIGAELSWFITRSITRPIIDAVIVADRVASGDLTGSIHTSGRDEVTTLFHALSKMNRSLNNVIGEVRKSIWSMSTIAGRLTKGNLDLARRTKLQADHVKSTSVTLEGLTVAVQENTTSARAADQLTQVATNTAIRGGEMVVAVVRNMDMIKRSSEKVAEITNTIDGIAFQINILALNASVEAARAGSHGRGFAVVASEVQSLAQRSAAAAKEIKTLIVDSVNKVAEGSELVANTRTTMDEVVSGVKKVSEIMTAMLAESEEQARRIDTVNQAVELIDKLTRDNMLLVEQVAETAGTMEVEGGKLTNLANVFKTDSRHNPQEPISLIHMQDLKAEPPVCR